MVMKEISSQRFGYRVTNWREYNKALKHRGSLTFWLSEDFEKGWFSQPPSKPKRGRPFVYSQVCLHLILTLVLSRILQLSVNFSQEYC